MAVAEQTLAGMKRQIRTCLLILGLGAALTGCAHVPPESVQLSQNIGTGIADAHRAYVAMINLYFDQKRDAIDQWIQQKYVPLYISTVRAKLTEKHLDPNSFDEALTTDIIQRITKKRDEMQAELEKTRIALLDKVESNNALLVRANNQLTAMLASAAKVQEANAALANALQQASGGKIDFQQMNQRFDAYLEKAGDISQKATSLYDALQPAINQ
jgi:hypothetical protein